MISIATQGCLIDPLPPRVDSRWIWGMGSFVFEETAATYDSGYILLANANTPNRKTILKVVIGCCAVSLLTFLVLDRNLAVQKELLMMV
mmetsp:Transcript_31712/g.46625  ORF Transcript_31712/g.46625 Transcript_31712/m.46625 type:complete len:89 (-) Transcript_31712:85-351(-)